MPRAITHNELIQGDGGFAGEQVNKTTNERWLTMGFLDSQ